MAASSHRCPSDGRPRKIWNARRAFSKNPHDIAKFITFHLKDIFHSHRRGQASFWETCRLITALTWKYVLRVFCANHFTGKPMMLFQSGTFKTRQKRERERWTWETQRHYGIWYQSWDVMENSWKWWTARHAQTMLMDGSLQRQWLWRKQPHCWCCGDLSMGRGSERRAVRPLGNAYKSGNT